MKRQRLHLLFFKYKFQGKLYLILKDVALLVFLLIMYMFFSRFLLQLVGILLEDIVTKQLKVNMNEQQHTFYCQELGTLLMCLIHIFKSGNTLNVALCCSIQWQGGFFNPETAVECGELPRRNMEVQMFYPTQYKEPHKCYAHAHRTRVQLFSM